MIFNQIYNDFFPLSIFKNIYQQLLIKWNISKPIMT